MLTWIGHCSASVTNLVSIFHSGNQKECQQRDQEFTRAFSAFQDMLPGFQETGSCGQFFYKSVFFYFREAASQLVSHLTVELRAVVGRGGCGCLPYKDQSVHTDSTNLFIQIPHWFRSLLGRTCIFREAKCNLQHCKASTR